MFGNIKELQTAVEIFRDVLTRVPDSEWARPTCCDDWSVRDIAEHVGWRMRRLSHLAAGSAVAEPAIQHTALGDRPLESFDAISSHALQALTQPGVQARTGLTRFGEISLKDVVSIMWIEPLIHAWDIADAAGIDHGIDQLIATHAYASLYPLAHGARAAGRFDPITPSPGDADMVERLITLAGRRSVHAAPGEVFDKATASQHITNALPKLLNDLERVACTINRLNAVAAQVPPVAWDNPTTCSERDVRAVARHCAFQAARIGADAAGSARFDLEDDFPAFDDHPAVQLKTYTDRALDQLFEPGALDQPARSEFGEMRVEDAIGLLWIELLIHTWDIADATGLDHGIDEENAALAFAQTTRVRDIIGSSGLYLEQLEPDGRMILDNLIAYTGRVSVQYS